MKLSTVWVVCDPWPLCRLDDICFSVHWSWLTTTVLPPDSFAVYTDRAEATVDATRRLADLRTDPLLLDALADRVSHEITRDHRAPAWCVVGEVTPRHLCALVLDAVPFEDIQRADKAMAERLPPGLVLTIVRSAYLVCIV